MSELNPSPSLVLTNHDDKFAAHAVLSCQLPKREASGVFSNGTYVLLSQFCVRGCDTTSPTRSILGTSRSPQSSDKGMAAVLGRHDPFQVREGGVGLIPIAVVDLFAERTLPQESLCDQPMNAECPPPTAVEQLDREIPEPVGSYRQYMSAMAAAIRAKRPNLAKCRDLIAAFISHDGSPLFSFQRQGELCARMGLHRRYSFRCHAAGQVTLSPLHLL